MVVIHPFMDGNGRLSRVMAVWALARHGWRKELCLAAAVLVFRMRRCTLTLKILKTLTRG